MTFDFEYARQILPHLLDAMAVNVEATFGGMAIALVVGLLFATARMSPWRLIRAPVTGVVTFIRATPLLVQLFLVFYMLPQYGLRLSPLLTGVLVLGAHYSCYMAEVYRAGISAVARGQWEAGTSLGLSPVQIWTRVILPQAIPPIIPVAGNYLIAMYKDSALLAVITVREVLGTALEEASITFRYLEPITMVGLLFLVVSFVSGLGVRRLEKRYGTVAT